MEEFEALFIQIANFLMNIKILDIVMSQSAFKQFGVFL